MKILFKKEPIFYQIQSSEREAYETDSYYLLKVVDFSGKLEKELKKNDNYESMEQILKVLLDAYKDAKLYKYLMKFIDVSKFDLSVSILEKSRDSIAVVKITKRRFREKVAEKVKSIVNFSN